MQEFAPASMRIPKKILRRIPIGILSRNFGRNSDGRRSKRFDFAHRGAPATAYYWVIQVGISVRYRGGWRSKLHPTAWR